MKQRTPQHSQINFPVIRSRHRYSNIKAWQGALVISAEEYKVVSLFILLVV